MTSVHLVSASFDQLGLADLGWAWLVVAQFRMSLALLLGLVG